ncbi:hypothetical protein ABZP36_033904 [Zizania latifolia]
MTIEILFQILNCIKLCPIQFLTSKAFSNKKIRKFKLNFGTNTAPKNLRKIYDSIYMMLDVQPTSSPFRLHAYYQVSVHTFTPGQHKSFSSVPKKSFQISLPATTHQVPSSGNQAANVCYSS